MELKYDKLWFRLAEKGMKKKDLQSLTGLSSATIARLSHNLSVSTKTLERICQALGCDISDILDCNSTFQHDFQKTNSTFGMNSFFSGIGGFDIGFERQGFKTNYLCEINDYCNDVLTYHWPNVKRGFDINEVKAEQIPDSEVWCGGFPCQDISVARGGERLGLAGSRSGLFYRFADLIEQKDPQVVVLENVAGLLNSNHGRDFGVILNRMTSMGYSVAWRLLNTRYFGAPQSRPRMYLCCWKGNPIKAAHTLFDENGAHHCSAERSDFITPSQKSGKTVVPKVAYCLAATSGRHTGTDWSRTYVVCDAGVRRMTPIEYERLQGFPDCWTQVDEEKYGDPQDYDTLRYTALGNAVSVPVIEWIAQKMHRQLSLESPETATLDKVQSLVPEFQRTTWQKLGLSMDSLSDDQKVYKWPRAGIAWGDKYIGASVPPSPHAPIASDLGTIIQDNVLDQRYYLTPNAAEGILRRVNSQNRKLFNPLQRALETLSSKK